jgi:hypothetical protein
LDALLLVDSCFFAFSNDDERQGETSLSPSRPDFVDNKIWLPRILLPLRLLLKFKEPELLFEINYLMKICSLYFFNL